MSVLETIHAPEDVKKLSPEELDTLCDDLRHTIVETVSKNGGHLSSNLGVVELTVALHKMFTSPHDQIVWDVGHQCYCHKLLTGRKEEFDTLRKTGGLSGFPRPSESPYDAFVAGHSSTSVSAANGIAKAKALAGDDGYVVAVIGDGALTGGLSYEGLCNAGRSHDRLIVILNDNQMSISRNVGFIARHLAMLRSGPRYVQAKNNFGNILSAIPLIGEPLHRFVVRIKCRLKNSVYHSSSTFEDMGYYYLGPVNGHNLRDLTRALQTAKNLNRPVLLHVDTVKGQGYTPAMQNPDKYHGISAFDPETGMITAKPGPNFSTVVGDQLCKLAEEDPKICVATAAMTGGTGLTTFSRQFPKRFFDVGIAEEHAVTFASGLAVGGYLPVFAVYATFLQRSYDQLLNDTAIMNNHIVLAIDRAGVVPDDGETHQGIFDVPFLSTIPNTTIFAPSTYDELAITLKQALYETEGIAAVRYPKGGQFPHLDLYKSDYKPFTHFRNASARTVVITYGRLFSNVLQAVQKVQEVMPVSVIKLTRIHPIPEEVLTLSRQYQRIVFFEEGARNGGIAQQLGSLLMESRYRGKYEIHAIDGFIPTCSVEDGLKLCRLDVSSMVKTLLQEDLPGGRK